MPTRRAGDVRALRRQVLLRNLSAEQHTTAHAHLVQIDDGKARAIIRQHDVRSRRVKSESADSFLIDSECFRINVDAMHNLAAQPIPRKCLRVFAGPVSQRRLLDVVGPDLR